MTRRTTTTTTTQWTPSTTMTRLFLVIVVMLVLTGFPVLPVVQADKDDSYYMAGQGNPNVNSRMYWKDAENILQDLSKFKALYVQYSHCAWTWCKMEEADNDVDENDYWYMGKIPPMGANVAYSLYGQLKGDSSFSGCNGDTFINSFYTNRGFQDFAASMYAAEKKSAFAKYSYSHQSNGDDDDDDSYSGPPYDATCGGGYGVGCDATYGFAVHTYSTKTCNPEYVSGVQDSLSNLNSALSNAQCVKIYDSSNYNKYAYNNNDDGADDGSSYSYGTTALALLSTSSACFYQNFYAPDGNCPDPYGKIAGYRQNFANGLEKQKAAQPYEIYVSGKGRGQTLVGLGIALMVGALVLAVYEIYLSYKYPFRSTKTQTTQHDGLIKTLSAAEQSKGGENGGAADDNGSNVTPKLVSAPSHESIMIRSSPSWWTRVVGRTKSMDAAEDAVAVAMGKKSANQTNQATKDAARKSRTAAAAASSSSRSRNSVPQGDAVYVDHGNYNYTNHDDDYDDPGFFMWMVQKATGSQKSAKKPTTTVSGHYDPHASTSVAAPRQAVSTPETATAQAPTPDAAAASTPPPPPSSPTPLYTGAQTVAQSVQETTAPLYTTMSQSVQDTVNYRMAVFNYNVGRVRDSISSILPSSTPATAATSTNKPAANASSLEMATQGQPQAQTQTPPVPSNLTDGDLSQLTEATGERTTLQEKSMEAARTTEPTLDPLAPPALSRSKEALGGGGVIDEVASIRASMEHDDGAQQASDEQEIVLPNRVSIDALEVPNNSSSMDSSARMERMLDRAFDNALRDDTAAASGPNIPETIISSPSDADESNDTSVGRQLMNPPSGLRK